MPKPLHLGPYDCTLALLRAGNPFIHNLCERYQTDVFTIRLMLRKTVCLRGPEAAEAFYRPNRMTRAGSVPANVLTLLQDKGSVHTLDGDAHRVRKQMFMRLMTPAGLTQVAELVATHLRAAAGTWQEAERVVMHPALQQVYCQAVCEWVGIALSPAELTARTEELAAMIDGAGSVGLRNWRGQWLRRRTERWARQLIRGQRQQPAAEPTTPLAVIANHRDADGAPLTEEVAAVELLNLLRPTVAVANFAVFTLAALAEHPDLAERLRAGDLSLDHFIHEVRRFYPFFPLMGGIAREPFEFHGYRFERGQRFILDLYGTNHHPLTWINPDQFNPDRFAEQPITAYNLIPQGGGDFELNHRCAGEHLTLAVLRATVDFFLNGISYSLPEQDLSVDPRRMPALPKSRVILTNIAMKSEETDQPAMMSSPT